MALFNLDNVALTHAEQVVLGLGYKFLPHTYHTENEIKLSISHSLAKLSRSMKLRMYFAYTESKMSPIPRLLNNSFMPPVNEDYITLVDNYIDGVRSTVNKARFLCKFTDIDSCLLRIIQKLKSRKDIIVKPADKNLGTVVMSVDHYHHLCMDILADANTYQIIDRSRCDFISNAWHSLEQVLNAHDALYNRKRDASGNLQLSKLARSLLQLRNSSMLQPAAHFYILPKVHKSPIVGRPIAASINTVTYFASKFLDRMLQPLMKKLPSICTSSRDVLRELTDLTVPNDCYIMCADVKNLYPSIPLDYGMRAVRKVLENYRYEEEQLDFLLDLLYWVLTNNYIKFDSQVYLQRSGTAMGTPVAVCYANIVLFHLEQKCLELNPLYYRRYIDDIFAIVESVTQGNRLVCIFNEQCSSIQLDGVSTGKSGVFLDLEISVQAYKLRFKLYQKPSNKYLYLHYKSAHSKQQLKNIIVQELKRYRLFCSDDGDFIEVVMKFFDRLQARGYPKDFLLPLFRNLPARSHLLEQLQHSTATKRSSSQEDKSPLVITLQIPSLCKPFPWHEALLIPEDLKNHERFQRAYGADREVTLGRRFFRHLGDFFR
jgi:hypothetical protein